MRGILDGLTPSTPRSNTTHELFRLADIKAVPGVVVTEPARECYLAVLQVPDHVTIHFVGLEWMSEDDSGPECRAVFKGEGTGGNLRELRHTWFAPVDDGYLFYLDIDKTTALLNALKEHFDGD